MSNEVVTQNQNTEIAEVSMEEWGENTVSSKDIVVPKILCMQGLSKQVMDGKARFGEFVDSLTGEKLGDMNTPIEFIPFHLDKTWVISKLNGPNAKYEKTEACTPLNENRPYEEVVNGVKYQNKLSMNFYVLRKDDMCIPYIISFKGTSLRAGKTLATQMFIRNRQMSLVPAGIIMKLCAVKKENDRGIFATWTVEPAGKSTKEQVSTAYQWLKTIKSKPVQVHNVDEAVEEVNASDEVPF